MITFLVILFFIPKHPVAYMLFLWMGRLDPEYDRRFDEATAGRRLEAQPA